MKTRVKTILFALTAMLLLASPIQQATCLVKFKKLYGVMEEKPKPQLTLRNWTEHRFQDDAEAYLQQHYGLREPLTRLYNQYIWDFYGQTFAKERSWVFVSDDNWYYEAGYVQEFYEGSSWKYAKDSLEMATTLGREALMLSQIQQILEGFNIPLFVLLEPGKEQIYPEHVPENTHYNREKVFSAHEFLHRRFEELGVNFIDAGEWFLQMKDTADFPLFPQTGTHWSNLAAMYVADSLIRYMEDLGDVNMTDFSIGKKYVKTKEPDDDLERLLNLMRPLKKAPNYYAKTKLIEDPTAVKPRLITIGDSFYWNILNHTPFKRIFDGVTYWYYFSSTYFDGPDGHVSDIDLLEKVMAADFVMLAYSTPQQYELGNGFPERFLTEWCYDEEEIEQLKAKTKESIRNNSKWMASIEQRAEERQIPVDSLLSLETAYVIKKRPDQCFPALKDSVPTKHSAKAEKYLEHEP